MIFLTGCSQSSLDDYREEGVVITYSLIKELHKIKNRQQLLESSAKLEGLFNELVDVMIAAQEFKQKNMTGEESHHKVHLEISDGLRIELTRLYQIEGSRQIIEKYEEHAMQRLDLYEKKVSSQKT